MDSTCSIILAAGKGTRLKSDLPKVLHEILGHPLIFYSLALAGDVSQSMIAVVGHGRDLVTSYLDTFPVKLAVQEPQLGTGHAILMAKGALDRTETLNVLILPGDMPLIRKESLRGLLSTFHQAEADVGILTARIQDPFGYGRIVRDRSGKVNRIVEHNDATEEERTINEINTSVYAMNKSFLLSSVERLCPENTKGELYLTDVVAMANKVVSYTVTDPDEAHGINSRGQLAFAQERMQQRINCGHMDDGVTLEDPRTIWIGPAVRIGRDVRVWPGTHILGSSRIEDGVTIMPNAWIRESHIGPGSLIGAGCVIEDKTIGQGSTIAPHTLLG
jgi:bifunctional UDP-N-acetylglucosamine pyrophosphorylase/glucosamine-1-phosphate N-acetyltransferase